MKQVALWVFVALIAWQGYSQFRRGAFGPVVVPAASASATLGYAPAPVGGFSCDRRTHCAQMTSCAEARYFQQNCRDADLEVDAAGVPCARRWCTSPNAP
jgi:hypothetical protein